LLLHYLMMLVIAAIFYGISRQLTFLARKPIVWGPVYGFLVYWVMNLVVMQWSMTPNKWRFIPLSFATGIIVHMFCIGLPIAWAVGRASARQTAESG
jgi:xanthine/uracil permease